MTEGLQEARTPPRRIGAMRIAIGVAAGLALWGLHEAADDRAWPAGQPGVFGALAAVATFAPFVLLGGLAALRGRTLVLWSLAAAAVLALLGWHDMGRRDEIGGHLWLSVELMAFGAGGLFVAHELVAAGDAERRLIARYPTYFETAWKHGVQIVLSAGFVGVFWLLLFLGASLFRVIGIRTIEEVIREPWFAFAATAGMFAAAIQLTDVRAGLIRGIRTVALTLLSWLLPVLAVLAAAFLLALPFTGLEPLWKTRSAAGILLSAAATLIVLINAAYQDGEPDGIVPIVLRGTTRLAAVLLAPLVVLSGYALWLRIGQYGLTPDRVVGIAFTAAGAVYAAGYAFAALRPGRWMRRLELTNLVAAFVVLALLLAIFTPLADPARLSVDNQMARLASGKVTAAKFDYDFLRFDGQRYGREALELLVARGGEVGRRAATALATDARRAVDPTRPPEGFGDSIIVWPRGAALPPGFLAAGTLQPGALAYRCSSGDARCDATSLDMNGDGHVEVLLAQGRELVVYGERPGLGWRELGRIDTACSSDPAEALREGRLATSESRWRNLREGDMPLPFLPEAGLPSCETGSDR
jgi:hypothetical protein